MLGRVTRLLPDALMARLLPAARRFDPLELPKRLPLDTRARQRVVIGAENSAGQGHAWAAALTDCIPGVSAASFAVDRGSPFGHPVDRSIPAPIFAWSRDWQRAHREQLLAEATHVLIEGGRPILAGGMRGSVRADARLLLRRGIGVAYLWHGSDIRAPEAHAARFPHSPFRAGLWEATPALRARTARSRALLKAVPAPSFVSTPDLLRDLPDAAWLPVVVDPHRWTVRTAPLAHGARPVVVHAPSRSIVKGSDLIDPVLTSLHEEGVIEYRRLEAVPHAEMPGQYATADIVIDQVRLDLYGVLACEAMAAGRIVVSAVSDEMSAAVDQQTGRELPITATDADQLGACIRAICDDPTAALARAAAGPDFVREVHDGRRSARVIADVLGLGAGPKAGAR